MHPKHKGSLAELLACAWLLKQGYEVFRNISQHGAGDLVIWRHGETPILVDVRTLNIRVAADGKSCAVVVSKKARHPDVRFLYACPEIGDCGFDIEALVMARGYVFRPPPRRRLGCSVAGCERKHRGKGFCNLHYARWRLGLVDGASLIPQP